MSTFADLLVRIGANVDDFLGGMAQVSKAAEAAVAHVEEQFAGLEKIGSNLASLGTALSASLTLPIVGLGTAALDAAGKFEQTQITFKTLLGSADKAKSMLKD